MRRGLVIVALCAAVAAATALAVVWATAPGSPRGPGAVEVRAHGADWSYVIPPGTGRRLDSGRPVEILPDRIEARVGEVIRIVNRDSRGYLLGPFYVGPRETVTQRFTTPGTFEGSCAVHPDGDIVLTVSE